MILYRIQAMLITACTLSLGYILWQVLSASKMLEVKVFMITFYLIICAVAFGAIRQIRREAQEKQ